MSKFFTVAEVRDAVIRLKASSARTRLGDYLVGLRTLRLSSKDEVGVAQGVPEYARALDELCRCVPEGVESKYRGFPYYNAFGGQASFRSPKYASNGPGNTMHNWSGADSPIILNADAKPKAIRRKPAHTAARYQAFLLQGPHAEARRPRLIDAAVWFFRSSDVERSDGSAPTREQLEEDFIDAMGLTPVEVSALFRRAEEDADFDVLSPDPLPDPEEPTGEVDA